MAKISSKTQVVFTMDSNIWTFKIISFCFIWLSSDIYIVYLWSYMCIAVICLIKLLSQEIQ